MIGKQFVHFSKDPTIEGRINVKTGSVKRELGGGTHFYLEFAGKNFKFGNVFSAEQLTAFAFFNTEADAIAFTNELIAQQGAASAPRAALPSPAEAQ